MNWMQRRRAAMMGAKKELPILNPSVGLTENKKLDSNQPVPYMVTNTGSAVTDFIYTGQTGSFVYFNPSAPAISKNGYCGKIIQYNGNSENQTQTDAWNCRMNGTEGTVALASNKRYIRLSLPMENLSGVYAYNSTTGQIYYAGRDTEYYGKTNIND